MFERTIEKQLLEASHQYPVVTITGPRQSGKTTVVQRTFPNKPYANLELTDVRLMAESDPRKFLNQFPDGAILDEIQHVPGLLSYIQVIADERDQAGLFILTGSHQMSLHQAISQSLAGRTALLTLLPMTLSELGHAGFNLELNAQLLYGGYPRIYRKQLDPTEAYRHYFHTYIERDVRQLINIKNLNLFNKFIKLCAGRIGSTIEANNLANEVGVSHHTINQWLSILEASYIIFRLPPYFENFGKRVIKSPKLYFTDVGLAAHLLDIETTNQIARDPLRGALFENLVILELMKYRLNQGKDPKLYFYRDNHQNEVDAVIKLGHELIPIEIKSAETFHDRFLKGLKYFKTISKDRTPRSYLVYAGSTESTIHDCEIMNYTNTDKIWQTLESEQ
ncbi:MAG: ATP-binding protein [Gammaproteobacteria bacterium]|nr:ATP-binding protein [Gammaproteobacteria bacterium]